MLARLGQQVLYRTDGRNGLVYDLPAVITCTQDSHPGEYPDGKHNPCPVPTSPGHAHLTVFTPGGAGAMPIKDGVAIAPLKPEDWIGAESFTPGNGTYSELDVPCYDFQGEANSADIPARTWRPME